MPCGAPDQCSDGLLPPAVARVGRRELVRVERLAGHGHLVRDVCLDGLQAADQAAAADQGNRGQRGGSCPDGLPDRRPAFPVPTSARCTAHAGRSYAVRPPAGARSRRDREVLRHGAGTGTGAGCGADGAAGAWARAGRGRDPAPGFTAQKARCRVSARCVPAPDPGLPCADREHMANRRGPRAGSATSADPAPIQRRRLPTVTAAYYGEMTNRAPRRASAPSGEHPDPVTWITGR